jgi:hypothetical protein
MRVERAGSRLLLMHGDDLIAEGQKTVVELAIPKCLSLHAARSASTGYPGLDRHPFPGCFVCGPQRAADGLAVFPGISPTDPAATYVPGRMAGRRIRPLDAAP